MQGKISSISNNRKLIFILRIHTFLTALILALIILKPSLSFDVFGLVPLIFFSYSVYFSSLLNSKRFLNTISIGNSELNIECEKFLVDMSWRIVLVTWLLSNGISYKLNWLMYSLADMAYVTITGILF